MSDDLRTRIAATVYRHILFRALDQCECGKSFDGFCGRSLDAYAAHVADAVIAELGPLVRYWDKDFKELHYCRGCGGWGPMDA